MFFSPNAPGATPQPTFFIIHSQHFTLFTILSYAFPLFLFKIYNYNCTIPILQLQTPFYNCTNCHQLHVKICPGSSLHVCLVFNLPVQVHTLCEIVQFFIRPCPLFWTRTVILRSLEIDKCWYLWTFWAWHCRVRIALRPGLLIWDGPFLARLNGPSTWGLYGP